MSDTVDTSGSRRHSALHGFGESATLTRPELLAASLDPEAGGHAEMKFTYPALIDAARRER